MMSDSESGPHNQWLLVTLHDLDAWRRIESCIILRKHKAKYLQVSEMPSAQIVALLHIIAWFEKWHFKLSGDNGRGAQDRIK
jgi:hypothetical protein